MDTKEYLVDFQFCFQVQGDAETTRRLLGGEARITSALLYQAADRIALEGVAPGALKMAGEDLRREAPKRVEHGWVGAAAMWIVGFVCGVATVSAVLTW